MTGSQSQILKSKTVTTKLNILTLIKEKIRQNISHSCKSPITTMNTLFTVKSTYSNEA